MSETSTALSRARVLRTLGQRDSIFGAVTWLAAVSVLVILGAIFVSLIIGAMPAFRAFGFGFLTTSTWNPVTDKFGALSPIVGTLVTALIAMLIAVPIGLGIAVFLTERCPLILRRPLNIAIQLLAGIPSIIYGIWGLFVFAPFMQAYIQPALINSFAHVPVFSSMFAGPAYGLGMLTAGLIVAIMVLPFITSVSCDVFETVPPMLKEAAYGQGCTTWEVVSKIVIPYTRVGLLGGVMLALGRALGETMAVTFVIGNSYNLNGSVLAPATTISATIANEFAEALGDLYPSAQVELGLILFVISFIVLAIARFMLMRLDRQAGA